MGLALASVARLARVLSSVPGGGRFNNQSGRIAQVVGSILGQGGCWKQPIDVSQQQEEYQSVAMFLFLSPHSCL